MTRSRLNPAGEHIIEPMLALAGCSKQQPIVVIRPHGYALSARRRELPRFRRPWRKGSFIHET